MMDAFSYSSFFTASSNNSSSILVSRSLYLPGSVPVVLFFSKSLMSFLTGLDFADSSISITIPDFCNISSDV